MSRLMMVGMTEEAPRPELYVAILINEIVVEGPAHVPDFEESIVLVRAGSVEEAERVAEDYARHAETSYPNADGETVRWVFRHLAAVGPALAQDLQVRAGSGVEIFSRFFHDLEAYREAGGSPDAARWTPELLAASADPGNTP